MCKVGIRFNNLVQPVNRGSPSREFEPISTTVTIGELAPRSSPIDFMEQESEGGQPAAMQQQWRLELDSKVRAEANLGFQQIRSIEEQLCAAPQGFLGRPDGAEVQALRTNIISAAVTVVGSFNKIIGWLSAAPPNNSSSFRNDNFSALDRIIGRAESPVSTSHTTYDSSPPHSPRHSNRVSAAANSKQPINQHSPTSPVLSPCHTPHSGSGMSKESHNPLSPPATMDSDGDPAATVAADRARRPANEAGTSADHEVVKHKSLSMKRKFMPKVTVKQRSTGTDSGNDGPPDDGHTWRKYGQKDILGSTNPRSYYRCTHKTELGCPALKFVQRCDDDPSTFDVTYRGKHICQSIIQQQLPWPFYTPDQVAMIRAHHQLPPSDPTCSPPMVNFPSLAGTLMNSSAAQQNHVMGNSNEILLDGTRPIFRQISATMRDGVPNPTTPRFGSAPSSLELGIHQQDFSVKPEDSNPSQQAAYDLTRLTSVSSDGLFGPESNLYNILLASTRPEQNVIPCTLGEEDVEFHGDLKRVKMQQLMMEPTRSASSDNSGLVDKSSDVVQTGEIWGQDIDAEDLQSLRLDEQVVSARFSSNSSTIADNGQSNSELHSNQPASAERGQIQSIREMDISEQRSVQFSMGLDITDYEPIIFTGGGDNWMDRKSVETRSKNLEEIATVSPSQPVIDNPRSEEIPQTRTRLNVPQGRTVRRKRYSSYKGII